MKANDLKPGMAVNINGDLLIVRKTEHVKPGKGPAYVQAKMKSISGNNIVEKRFRASEDVDNVTLDRREMEYLYSDSNGHIFMDQESYDQVTINADLIGDQMQFIKPNTIITVLMHDENAVTVSLPSAVDLLVKETSPQPKGVTATNQLKEATMETGLKTRVPPFIENGEMLRINTEDGSYISRVS